MTQLQDKKILLGITGAIAAYKSADLCRRLREAGAEVRVVLTNAAKSFITPLTMQAVSGNPVHTDLFDLNAEAAMGHIELARWADLIIIAPASADFIAHLAHGFANDLLSTLCLASKAKVAVAPSMNEKMWHHPATQANLQILKDRDILLIGPEFGEQACGDIGLGRMSESTSILSSITTLFAKPLFDGITIMITAGPTREFIDPVRYISNCSSGKMGYALAEAALEANAKVILVSGPTALAPPSKAKLLMTNTAEEMLTEVMSHIDACDIFIGAAAVADYRPADRQKIKIKKSEPEMNLTFVRNPDILENVAERTNRPFTVGFAAETNNEIENAEKKRVKKNLNLIIANRVGQEGSGFDSDQNACTIIWQEEQITLPLMPKKQLAREIIKVIANQYANDKTKNT
jgi:phosphopantothenoylcysteine decarboxylase/phosphopantothenate--cysteine ligase